MGANKKQLHDIIYHPHDGLFKQAMGYIAVARDLLKRYISQDITSALDWGTLQSKNRGLVKEQLTHLHTDVVYQSALRDSLAHICFLIEHQSTPDRLLPFRMTKYDIALMEQHLKQSYKHVPIMVNLCLYASKQTPYPYSIDLYDCFADPLLAQKYMGKFFRLILVDLTTISEAELLQHGQADLLQILLKRGVRGDFLSWVKSNPGMILRLLDRPYARSGIYYMLSLEEWGKREALLEAIASVEPKKKGKVMTIAQDLWMQGKREGKVEGIAEGEVRGEAKGEVRGRVKGREEGIIQGREEGIVQGVIQGMEQGMEQSKLEIARRMLQVSLSGEQVRECTGLGLRDIERLKNGL
ncbi:MAG: Rpn family recombination-promoting nuclease/putative transposase [Bacteroidota bacterium]